MPDAIATGSWLTAARVRFVLLVLLTTSAASLAALLLTRHGTLDALGRPLGTDFSDVYAAGWMARHGQAADAWVWARHYAVQQRLHGDRHVPFYPWPYPPPFLLAAAALAGLPYLLAWAVWQGATLLPAAVVIRAIAPGRGTLLAVLAAPATLICVTHGQNGFLTAALLGGGLLLLDRCPLLAGALLGALLYKPQFLPLLPVLLLAAGRPRALGGAALSAGALVAATLAIWGWPVWAAFLHALPATRTAVIENGGPGWEKVVSAFAAARALGTPLAAAYAIQGMVAAFALATAAAAARAGSPALRGATAASAALSCTPYLLDYDLTLAGVATAFLVADARTRGWLGWEKTVLATAFLVPLAGRQVAEATLVPVDWLTVMALAWVAGRRLCRLDLRPALRSSPSRRSRAASAR